MTKHIFLKLKERIDKRDFNRIQVGTMTMMGLLLGKADWKRYQKALPSSVLMGYDPPELMWFRGYPLKQK